MVDAEQTYFQTAINYFATELQRYYNKSNVPYIHGTYQCYLKVSARIEARTPPIADVQETLDCLRHDLALAEKEKYIFAAKLVRGAYMDQERRLAREQGYDDPVNADFEATTEMYHTCLEEVMKSVAKRDLHQVKVMIASHNEDTIRYAIRKYVIRTIRIHTLVCSLVE